MNEDVRIVIMIIIIVIIIIIIIIINIYIVPILCALGALPNLKINSIYQDIGYIGDQKLTTMLKPMVTTNEG